MADKKFGWGLIGYGGMGNYHFEKLSLRDDVEIIGTYDINPERQKIAESKGLHAFATADELLNDDRIDFITIATPNEFHKDYAIRAMEAGKAVISEKPVTMSSEELDEMIKCSERTGKLFTVHQNRRWDPCYLTVKKIYDDNKLGRIFRFEHRVHGSRGVPGDWRNRQPGGGMVYDWGVHLLDQMLTMMVGHKIISVYATLTHITNDEVDDGFTSLIKFDNDVEWLIEVSTNNFISLPYWYVLGENGSAQIDDWEGNGKISMVTDWENKDAVPVVAGVGLTKTMAPRTDDSIDEYPAEPVKSDWAEYYDNILDVLQGKATQIVTHAQQRRLVKLIENIFKSAELNETIKEVF
ncbi:MAG: Gfo/Idh/MocA family oxidoreductase [Clostridia bacterium]|nr:Gfo/Idh/MocA family oxidoreductase [Clostridia bacterium]